MYKAYAVELHVAYDVLTQSHSAEATARRQFARLCAATTFEVRLWGRVDGKLRVIDKRERTQ